MKPQSTICVPVNVVTNYMNILQKHIDQDHKYGKSGVEPLKQLYEVASLFIKYTGKEQRKIILSCMDAHGKCMDHISGIQSTLTYLPDPFDSELMDTVIEE